MLTSQEEGKGVLGVGNSTCQEQEVGGHIPIWS